MARGTCGGLQGLCVAVAARGATMVDPSSTLIGNARVWTGVTREPVIGGMAARTIQTKHARVEYRVIVAARAVGRKRCKLPGGMAACAGQCHMRARQGEVAAVVIEIRVIPIRGFVAGRAIGTELTVVFVILLVAGIAVCGCAFVLPVHMTGLAIDFGVPAFELECCQIVIKGGRRPAVRGMALAAIQSKTALMRLIVMMAGIAILRRRRKIAKVAPVDMTLHTGKAHMLPGELEGKGIVIEIRAETIHTIMTVKTGYSE